MATACLHAASAPVISAVIIAASALQILANLVLVRPSLRVWGALGHGAVVSALAAALLLALALLMGQAPVRRQRRHSQAPHALDSESL